jgi:aryl-alcohol dehydrogenase-like predicted oxidoreductase
MQPRRVGRSDLWVTPLGIGGWLTFGERLDERASHAVLDVAYDAGIRLIDLADSYAGGQAERIVGRWLRTKRRDELVLTSKVYWPTGPGPDERGLGARHVASAIERSLANLGTDYIDVYFCHREDPDTPLAETARTLSEHVVRGKIRHWGTSVWSPLRQLRVQARCRVTGLSPPIVEQLPYSVLERWIERRTLPLVAALGMGVFAFSPLAGGLLSGKYSGGIPPGSRAEHHGPTRAALDARSSQSRRFGELASRWGIAPAALAIAWVSSRRHVSSVLLGCSSAEQVKQNVRAAELMLPDALVRELDRVL